MAQFDRLIVFPIIWVSLLFLFFYYLISAKTITPGFFGVKKLRDKLSIKF